VSNPQNADTSMNSAERGLGEIRHASGVSDVSSTLTGGEDPAAEQMSRLSKIPMRESESERKSQR
jgi:hypothetical protein